METTETASADFAESLLRLLHSGSVKDAKDLAQVKRKLCQRLGMDDIPKNGEALAMLDGPDREKFYRIFRSKPVRVLSGVNVVALMTKPYNCPHGICLFCPGGTSFGTPQSYTGFEPAARRAAANAYDPYRQTVARLDHYLFMGYRPQKLEVIFIGGTFTTLPKDYRYSFASEVYRAMNEFYGMKTIGDLEVQKAVNETAAVRCVALAVETKPERCGEEDVRQLMEIGATRVEMGVQSTFDDVLLRNNRGHTIKDVVDTTRRLKDNAYKVDYHVMLNLPGSDVDRDRETIRNIYHSDEFRPDAIKIYPTLVIKGTGLYSLWKRGEHTVYPIDDVVDIIAEAEANAPRWLRIMRVERDIPSNLIEDGVKVTNLRQLVQERLDRTGRKAADIRSREVGHVTSMKMRDVGMMREDYRSVSGDEIFLSFEDSANDALLGFIRLRIPDGGKEGLVRELHIYGEAINIGNTDKTAQQHKGLGRELLAEAERIARHEYSLTKVKVISGVGVREYYRKFGYSLEKGYMAKQV